MLNTRVVCGGDWGEPRFCNDREKLESNQLNFPRKTAVRETLRALGAVPSVVWRCRIPQQCDFTFVLIYLHANRNLAAPTKWIASKRCISMLWKYQENCEVMQTGNKGHWLLFWADVICETQSYFRCCWNLIWSRILLASLFANYP